MKEFFEPFFYPQNIVLLGLLLACICYRKKGLWVLLVFYYLTGNSFVANQARHWYSSTQLTSYDIKPGSLVVVLGCGGTEEDLTACARARLEQVAAALPDGSSVVITSRYCQPYIDYLLARADNLAVDCIYGGDNTYQEFNTLVGKTSLKPDYVLTSDFHAWRVQQLLNDHQLDSKILTSSSRTFRQLNCHLQCLLTVNLANYDLYSKLISEFASYGVYTLTRSWTDWYDAPAPQPASINIQ